MRCLLFLPILLVLICSGSAAAPLEATTRQRALVEEIAVLTDDNGKAAIDDIAGADESRFIPLKTTFSAGYTRRVHWLRITLQREASAPRNWLLEVSPSYLDDVRLYTPALAVGRGFDERRSGDHLPFSAREIAHRNFVFSLTFPQDTSPYVVYLRVQTTSTSTAQVSVWQPDAFDTALMREYAVLGVMLGMLLLLWANSLTHWIHLKEKVFLLFVCQILSMLITYVGINGLAAQFIFPEAPQIADLMTPVGTCLLNFFGYWFFIEFLAVRERHPRLLYVYLLTMLLSLVTLLGVFFGYYVDVAPVLMALSLLSLALCIWISGKSLAYGQLGARWVFAGYLWYGLATGLNLMAILGILPGDGFFILGWQHAAPAFVIFLQQGVMSRMREIERRHDRALVEAREAQAHADRSQKQREAQGKFLSLIAHELKMPLAVIDAAVQALGYSQPPPDPASHSRHERIRAAVARLNGLLEQSLNAARSEPEQLRLSMPRYETFAVSDFLSALVTTAEQSATSQPRTIECPPAMIESCYGDRSLLEMALSNLIENACKYAASESAIVVSANRRTHLGAQGIAFDVASAYVNDSGDDREAWFEKFGRGTGSVDKEGVGLGLYLVRTIAEAHGGAAFSTTSVDSGESRLIVTLWIPEHSPSEDA